MLKIETFICMILGFIVYWLGGLDTILTCLIAMIIIDYISGVLKAIINKNLSSEIGFKGIAKKVMILTIVALSFVIEKTTNGMFQIREIVIIFFIANESISLIENAIKIGLPVPKKLIDILEQLKQKNDKE